MYKYEYSLLYQITLCFRQLLLIEYRQIHVFFFSEQPYIFTQFIEYT